MRATLNYVMRISLVLLKGISWDEWANYCYSFCYRIRGKHEGNMKKKLDMMYNTNIAPAGVVTMVGTVSESGKDDG
ncbi:unnamed protein product [Heligmosomoides polygyrus]|uniref:Transposase n=1 Tax=Heligmosomoides polygyrus TaxID=6339 RepID=A0A183FMA6_HELPZ|nr:unnamed protein product [Heligmosomoides polygyrus]